MRLPFVGPAAATCALALLAPLAPLLATAAPAAADFATTCDPAATNVYRWTGGDASSLWNKPANWAKPTVGTWPAVPNDDRNNDGEAEFHETIVCIDAADTVTLDGNEVLASFVFLRELHVVGNFTIDIGVAAPNQLNAGLIVAGPEQSTLGPLTDVNVRASTLGGSGTLSTTGTIDLFSVTLGPSTFASTLTSRRIGETHAYTPGALQVDEGGELNLDSGVNLKTQYQVAVRGQATFTGPAYLAADQGTAFGLLPNSGAGGRLTLDGDGGYYAGFTSGALSTFVNNGRLEKVGGTGTSVIDAAYSGSGSVTVSSGELALPDNAPAPVTAEVDPGLTFATGRCGTGQTATSGTCAPVTSEDVDPRSVTFQTPATGPTPDVSLQELATSASSIYPATGVSKVVYAHAAGMGASETNPARITLRYSLGNGPEGTLGRDDTELLVSRIPDSGGSPQTLVDCASSTAIPTGQAACVDRASSHTTGGNVFLEVLAQETSRWIVRGREAVRSAPGAPVISSLTVRSSGAVDAVLKWRAGATGGAPITGYRVFFFWSNGSYKGAATNWVTGTSASLNLPRGRWRLAVVARNIVGLGKLSAFTKAFPAR